jgi:KaiC/GvpD/RAD55 family RecA-like ATPase
VPSAAHEVTELMGADELAARLAAIEADARIEKHYGVSMAAARAPEPEPHKGRYYDPLPNAADEYIAFAQSPFQRVYTGIDEFDAAMRGIAPGELMLIVGFAHSGKTVLTTEFILNNRKKRIAFFTPDETRVLVLIKLVSIVHSISAEVLEQRIANNDSEAIEMVRSTAGSHFPNLAVFDQGMGIEQMHAALDEAEAAWGDRAQAVIFDYADLLVGVDDSRLAITALKSFGKARHAPMIVLHQSSRTSGADGKTVTISSGGYGGEQQATFLVGVRRKKSELMAQILDLKQRIKTSTKDTSVLEDMKEEAEYELRQHENTVTFNLLKNKRPPSRLVAELDFELDPDTGRIRQLGHGELVNNLENRGVSWEQTSF